tara:strand:- start:540 stop:1004 length:465 start_codon:yes stop_codon:yes gene_type:complete
MSFKKLIFFVILPILSNILLSNALEKNRILNITVNHNYDITDPKYGDFETFFCFPFLYNDAEEIKSPINIRELKKLLKKMRKELPKNHSHIDRKKMDVKLINEGISPVNAVYSKMDKSDTNYFMGAAMNSFRKIDEKWKIFSITPFKQYDYFQF